MIQLGVFEFISPYWDKIGEAVNRVVQNDNYPICYFLDSLLFGSNVIFMRSHPKAVGG